MLESVGPELLLLAPVARGGLAGQSRGHLLPCEPRHFGDTGVLAKVVPTHSPTGLSQENFSVHLPRLCPLSAHFLSFLRWNAISRRTRAVGSEVKCSKEAHRAHTEGHTGAHRVYTEATGGVRKRQRGPRRVPSGCSARAHL